MKKEGSGKLFGKLNIIDLIVILIIIGGAAGFFYKFFATETATPFTSAQKIEIVFAADEIRSDVVDGKIKVGDIVKDRATGVTFGYVTKIETGPSRTYVSTDSGEIKMTPKPNMYSITVWVEGEGYYSGESAVSYGNNDFYVNNMPEVRIGKLTAYLRIDDFNVIS